MDLTVALASPLPVASPLFWPLAFAAGALSFTSPCCLPLLPGFLSFVSGLSRQDLAEDRTRLVSGCLLFVAGFALIFTAEGATASLLGGLVLDHQLLLLHVAGGFIILMGLFTMGVFRIPSLYVERRFHIQTESGLWGALPLGMAFGFGWTPCVGPVLASIDSVAAIEGSVRTGAALLFVYALGLGLPFVLTGVFVSRGLSAAGRLRRHLRVINLAGGAVLCLMGLLLLANQWLYFLSPVMRMYSRMNWPPV